MTVRVEKPSVNLREKLAELDKPTGIAGEAMLRAETPQEQFNLIGAGRRNILINGGFTVSQRGDYTTAASTSGNSYSLDRWNTDISGVTATIQNNTVDLPNGIEVKTAKLAATSSATGYLQLRQKIEVESWMQGREVTLSAWVKSNSSYPRLRIEGAAVGSNEDGTQTHSGSGEWEFLTFTTTLADGFGFFNAGVVLWNGSTVSISSGDYFELANVQLELGKVATPFEHRSYGEELALCQRYYEQLEYGSGAFIDNGWSGSTSGATAVLRWQTPKRTNPTITLPSPSNSNGIVFLTATGSYPSTVGTHNTTSISTFSCRINGSGYSGLGGGGLVSVLYTVGAQSIKIDAEL